MADISGPTSSMPGSYHRVPDGMMCDDHPDRPAVKRLQGETDSFGAEYHDLCQECLDANRAALAAMDTSGRCEWCGKHAESRTQRRDYDEGMAGRLYDVCRPCIDKESLRAAEELAQDSGFYDFED